MNVYENNYGIAVYEQNAAVYDPNGAPTNPLFQTGKFKINNGPDMIIYPVGRQEIEPPDVDLKFIEIPGSNIPLDLTDALTGQPHYKMRTGNFEFKAIYDRRRWDSVYSYIINTLQGKKIKLIRTEEPNYYYNGRLVVTSTKSDAYNGRIKIKGTFEAYKRDVVTVTDDWLWDPFSFDDGYVYNPLNTYWASDPPVYSNPECIGTISMVAGEYKDVELHGSSMLISPKVILNSSYVRPQPWPPDYDPSQESYAIIYINGNAVFLRKGTNTLTTVQIDFDTPVRLYAYYDCTIRIEYSGGRL